MGMTAGERFARGIAEKDAPALFEVLADDVEFRAITPGRFWESKSATEVVNDVILGRWFEPSDRIEALEGIDLGAVVDRERVTYRFRVKNDDGEFIVEQNAYLRVRDDTIVWLQIMCSGYVPVS
jgi:hypothetical protein